MNYLHRLSLLVIATAIGIAHSTFAATAVWTSASGTDTDWSNGANWSGGSGTGGRPALTDTATFSDTGGAASAGVVNNIVNSAFPGSIGALTYSQASSTVFHDTLLNPGLTLTVNGALTASTAATNYISGANGALVINSTSSNVAIQSGSGKATLNLSGLGSFTATVKALQVGGGGGTAPSGTVILAGTNVITASGSSPAIDIGDSGGNSGGNGMLFLGRTNTLFANTITVGRGKTGNSTMAFDSGVIGLSPTATFRGSSGGSSRVTTWMIQDGSPNVNGGTPGAGSKCDFTGGSVDALVSTMKIAQGHTGTASKTVTGTFTMTAGTMDVNNLYVGLIGSSGSNYGQGTVNVSGGLLKVNTLLTLGYTNGVSSSSTLGTLNVNSGTLDANTVVAGTGSGSNSISLTDATFIVRDTVGTTSVPISSIVANHSTLQVALKATPDAPILVNTLTCSGTSNVVNISSLPPLGSYPVTFKLIDYATLSGTYNFVLGTLPSASPAYQAQLTHDTVNRVVKLTITNGPITANSVVWNGTAGGVSNGNWDTSTANWLLSGSPSTYGDGFLANFDDTATGTTNVNLTTSLAPANVTVNNVTKTYTFSGSGALTGSAGLIKQGSGALILDNSGTNSFFGNVVISGGTLQVGNNDANGGLGLGDVADNALLVFNRTDNIAVANNISGSGGVTTNGSGSLTLGGVYTYAGATAVNAGNLILNGTLSGGGALTVAAGATLSGSGQTAGAVTINGLVKPGNTNTAGTLTSGNLTFGAGATVTFDVGTSAQAGGEFNDLLQVNGNVTLNNNVVTLNLIDLPQVGVPYRLMNYTGTLTGQFNPAMVVTGGTGYTAIIDYHTSGQINAIFVSGQAASVPADYPVGTGATAISLGADGQLVYTPDTNGDIIPDFSSAGYRGGGVPIPNNIPVVTTLSPISGDNQPQIQSAIDALAAQPLDGNGFRGVIVLSPGVYAMNRGITIRTSGIVVRGSGYGLNGTILRFVNSATAFSLSNGSGVSRQQVSGTAHKITDSYVPLGSRWFTLDSVSGLVPGDNIVIHRGSPSSWLNDLYPPDGKDSWIGAVDLSWERTIVAIQGKRVLIDAPLMQSLDKKYGGGDIYKFTFNGRTENSGFEDIRADCTAGVDENDNTSGALLTISSVWNCWMRRCMNDKMSGHTVSASGTRWCTFEDIISFHNPLPAGHSGASIQINTFNSGAQGLLFHRFTSSDGGFEWTSGGGGSGPNVFLECDIPHAFAFCGPHMKWTVGTLYDAIFQHNGMSVLLNDGSHGWGGGNHLAYNVEAHGMEFDRPPTAHQWVVGAISTASNLSGVRSGALPTEVISWQKHVDPRSLYRAQLAARVGEQQVLATLGQPYGDNYFTITATTASQTVAPGQNTGFPVTMTVTANYPGTDVIPNPAGSVELNTWPGSTVNFSVSGLPAGASASFTSPSLNNAGTTTLNVVTSASTPPGNYPLLIQGNGSSFPTIRSGTTSPLKSFTRAILNVTGSANFSVSAGPVSQTLLAGTSTTFDVLVTGGSGFSGVVTLNAAGLPSGSTASLSPSSITGSGISTATINVPFGAAAGDYTLTISGSSGGATKAGTVHLIVQSTGLPPPWTDADIGAPAKAGSATYAIATDKYTVNGCGSDIWSTSDQFNYVYQTLPGDFTITAHVLTQSNTDPWAKAGVMIRETTGANSKYVLAAVTPTASHGVSMQYRSSTGGSAVDLVQVNGPTLPYWVRLVRLGNAITGYRSPDGVTWTQIGSISVTMNSSVTTGLAVCSHNTSSLSTVTFDNVSIDYPSFVLSGSPAERVVTGGTGTSFTVSNTNFFGFNGTITLAISGLPNGCTASFTPATISGTGTSTLNITTSNATVPDSYQLTITGTSGALDVDEAVILTVDPMDTDNDGLPDWWMLANFGHATAQTGDKSRPLDDADGDGVKNLLEYAFDLDPRSDSRAYLPTVTIEDGYLTMMVNRNPLATGLEFDVAVSGDLNTWSSAPTDITVLEDTPALLKVRDNTPSSAGKRFMHLEVSVP
jgi:autotransporter-associated beta strand protein